MHHLDGLKENRGKKGKVEVASLGIGEALPIQKDGRLGGIASPEGRGGQPGFAVLSNVEASPCVKQRCDGSCTGRAKSRRVQNSDAGRRLVGSGGETAGCDCERRERCSPLHVPSVGLGRVGRRGLCGSRERTEPREEQSQKNVT